MKESTRYTPEVRERAVRMVFEHEHESEYRSQWAGDRFDRGEDRVHSGDLARLGASS